MAQIIWRRICVKSQKRKRCMYTCFICSSRMAAFGYKPITFGNYTEEKQQLMICRNAFLFSYVKRQDTLTFTCAQHATCVVMCTYIIYNYWRLGKWDRGRAVPNVKEDWNQFLGHTWSVCQIPPRIFGNIHSSGPTLREEGLTNNRFSFQHRESTRLVL